MAKETTPAKQENKFPKIFAASKADSISYVAEGLPVSQNGYLVLEADMTNIESALSAGETAASELATTKTTLQTTEAAKVKAEGELATANARIAELEKTDGVKPTAPAAKTETVHVVAEDEIRCDFDDELAALRKIMK